ncbi:hypothetical protein BCR44DRAFT_1119600 [Catenaria anguillulae PL171]|uniref:Uncharacterized protein n=1 Tax=Catenaria anguillulae PL171 TaxID=765915 RepID=A0A1Y2HLG3_9FUNG|nr:hypothetical protein BCR44DRAFT_1119600 [Catenaria anguillulae PL171]
MMTAATMVVTTTTTAVTMVVTATMITTIRALATAAATTIVTTRMTWMPSTWTASTWMRKRKSSSQADRPHLPFSRHSRVNHNSSRQARTTGGMLTATTTLTVVVLEVEAAWTHLKLGGSSLLAEGMRTETMAATEIRTMFRPGCRRRCGCGWLG